MIKSNHNKNISSILHRGIALMLFLLTFAIGVKAQKYYVIYYDEVKWNATIRHYVSISEDGTSIVDETTLSSRCFWKAESALKTAEGEKGINLKNTETNTTNQNNRMKLSSVAFPKKYIVESSSATEVDIENGTSYSLSIRETSVTPRWLIDNEIDGVPILYQYYHKQYLYYDYGWKYSSAGYKTGSVAKLLAYDAIPELPSPSFTVTLDDREDHNWTYYSGIEPEGDSSNAPDIRGDSYNERYAGKLYSPNPRNVKITYKANGGAVSLSESENEFVYYKTLECKTVGTGDEAVNTYPYTVISNPFSKRPAGKGFGGWKIIGNGYKYIQRADGNMAAENAILGLDEEITFVGLTDNYTKNCISAEIELEATWVNLNNIVRRTDTGAYEYSTSGGTYETNILVLKGNQTGTITVNSPCTIMMVEPDGSADYREIYTFTGSIVPFNNTLNDAEGNTKIEFAHWKPSDAIDALGRNFTIGRGMLMDGTTQALYGTNTASVNVDQILKVESGKFSTFEHFGIKPEQIIKQCVVFGCDYDRAKNNNKNLEFTSWMRIAYDKKLPTDSDDEICRVYAQSGSFMTGVSVSNANAGNCYYFNVRGTTRNVKGHRYLEILGGEWKSIAGGWGPDHSSDMPAFTFRMRGGHIIGSIYGGAEYQEASGTRTFIITGGSIKGWVAGGSNGTQTGGGIMNGESFIYVGGNAKIDSKESTTRINRAVGGNVFGAGCGYSATSTSGQVTLGTNVVIADNAYVERGVYGGGSYGYCPTDKTANIYITGGKVDGKAGGVDGTNYMDNIQGGIYGGACQNKGGSVNIFMTGGTVNGGLYGGSNASGEVQGPINLKMNGGIVVNVFGGGNEAPVKGNTNVTITGGEIKQNVYGGGNKAEVKGTTNVVVGKADK